MSGSSRLNLFPLVTQTAFLLPILVGLIFTAAPALGYLSVAGHRGFSLDPLRTLFAHPSLPGALRSTILSGVGAASTSLALALWIAATVHGTRAWRVIEFSLAPLLSLPHAAFAIGFVFLISPSGWLMRAVSPSLSGFTYPPDWITAGDPWAISLTLTMILKETPFLLLMVFSGLNRLDVKRTVWIGRSLGYHRLRIWTRLLIPQLYPMLRLPLLAVLAYSLSVVDLAYIIGPSLPPTLSVLIDRWFNDPDIAYRMVGAAGAVLLFVLTLLCIALTLLAEQLIKKAAAGRLLNGRRKSPFEPLAGTGSWYMMLVLLINTTSLLVLMIWSIARVWRFPDFLPSLLVISTWTDNWGRMIEPLGVSVAAALASCAISCVLVVGCLENELTLEYAKQPSIDRRSLWIVFMPLLIPQISFLFGIQVLLVFLHLDGTWLALIWIHMVFVLPYVFLTLASAYRSYDRRYSQVGLTLSWSPLKTFARIKLPILIKPILFSLAVGFSVSIAQYLPTLYVGNGRFATITTETVSLAAGSDRRIIAVYALSQVILPLLGYAAAIAIPFMMHRNRQMMRN